MTANYKANKNHDKFYFQIKPNCLKDNYNTLQTLCYDFIDPTIIDPNMKNAFYPYSKMLYNCKVI